MNGRRYAVLAVAAAALILTIDALAPAGADARPRYRRSAGPESVELILEGGAALPLGDLGDDYFENPRGFGAEGGYEVGVRFRAAWAGGWALSPSFHYQDFGDLSWAEDGTSYEVSTSIVRYGLDAQYMFESRRGGARPYLSGGIALCHNRYRDESLTGSSLDFYETSHDALAFAFGAGIKMDAFELSATYTVNRFESARLNADALRLDYDWDTFVVRAGFALPAN